MLKTKKEEQLSELYKPQSIEIKLLPKEENKLTELEKESKKISIKLSEESVTKKNIFTPSKFTCKIECPELNSSVIRSLEDIEWLKSQLNEKYPMMYIPPTPNKKNLKNPQSVSRYIQKFFNVIIRRKILRTSTLIQDFLTSDNIETYKKGVKEFKLAPNMENYKSNKESLKFDFKEEQLYLPLKYLKKIEPNKSLYNTLDSLLSQIANDFQFLNKHCKEASEIFAKLYKSAKDTDQSEYTKKVFEQLKGIFNDCATSYTKQSDFFEKDVKEFFNYIDMQLNEMNVIFSQYTKKRNEFESLGMDYLTKREKLFNEKKYNKWELTKEDEAKLDTFKDNKEEAMKYICKEMGNNVQSLKLQVGCFCNIVMKQFNHINKYVGEQMKEYFENVKEKNKELIEQGFTIFKLFNIQIEKD
jgi:hypothetical protein